MKVYVIDNGSQWTHREWRVLRYLKVDTKIVPNNSPFKDISDADAIVLSGGAPNVATEAKAMGNNSIYIDRFNGPILGVCAGMQFICEHFGGTLGPGASPEFGAVPLKVTDNTDLFDGLPSEFRVWASHNDEVKTIPDNFTVLAHSDACPHEAVRHMQRPIYGVQFHPEVEHTEYGVDIFKNFLKIVEKYNA